MDEAMEPQSIVPDWLAGQIAFDDVDRALLLTQIRAIEAQTRELAHIGDALSLLTNHAAQVANQLGA